MRLADRHADAGAGFEPVQDRFEEIRARRHIVPREGKRRRYSDAGRVHYGCLVQVVDFENMGKAAQHQRPAAGIALLSLQVGKQLFARN